MKTAIVAGIDSGLGNLIGSHLCKNGWSIVGTSRRVMDSYRQTCADFKVLNCDFSSATSIENCTGVIGSKYPNWEILILSIGTLAPIGNFARTNFNDWEQSFYVNFLGQMRFLHELLKSPCYSTDRLIISFAGAGTNSAPQNYSSYILAKIALIKSMEILAGEFNADKFVSLGTGWMDTPIHNQTIAAGERAGDSYAETIKRQQIGDFGKDQDLLDFIDFCCKTSREIVTGRNFSLQGDAWREESIKDILSQKGDMFKLRRFNHESPWRKGI